jgi:hypothetical protein
MGAHDNVCRRGTVASLGELLGGARIVNTAGRTFAPVRRNSYYADDPRALAVWRPIGRNKQEARVIIAIRMQAAQSYDREHKQKGQRNGPLGSIGIEVLRELYRMVDYRTGRLDPSIETIRKRLVRSKQAVHDAMERLQEHGFLVKVRRAEAIEGVHRGPQVRQITNANGFSLPKCVTEEVERELSNASIPDCELSRREAQEEAIEGMLSEADPEQYLEYLFANDNDRLVNGLLRLEAGLPK